MPTFRSLALGALFLTLASVHAAAAELPDKAPIVPGAIPLEEAGRYQSTRSYDDTLAYYERYFRRTGGVRWRTIINRPGIRARHIQSLRSKTDWAGLNVYERHGDVRIFVVPRDSSLQKHTARSKSRSR